MIKKILLLPFTIIGWLFSLAFASAATYNEAYFAELIAKTEVKGELEYRLPNRKRVDILTDTHAYEVDWISKAWSEGVGQALHYAIMTGKKPGVIVLIDKPHKANLNALIETTKMYDIDVKIFHVNKKTGRID